MNFPQFIPLRKTVLPRWHAASGDARATPQFRGVD